MTELDFSNLPFVSINDKNQLPSVSAVYIVFGLDKDCLYVGKAKNLKTRWANHHRFGMCVENGAQIISWITAEESELPKLEQGIMLELRPLLNGVPTLEKPKRSGDVFCFNTERSSNWLDSGLTASEALALVALMHKVTIGGMVYASQAELAERVKCTRPTMNKGLQSLIERNVVSQVPGKRAQYRIHECVGTKLA